MPGAVVAELGGGAVCGGGSESGRPRSAAMPAIPASLEDLSLELLVNNVHVRLLAHLSVPFSANCQLG